VVNTPHVNTDAVVEHTISLMLSLAKKIVVGDRLVRKGEFSKREMLNPIELTHKILGIIGLGRIGCRLAEVCGMAFRMKVIGYHPHPSEEKIKKSTEMGVQLTSNLEELLKCSDFVVLCVPLTPETRGMIGKKELKLMKPTAYLINVARGGIVKEVDLFEALKNKWIEGVALIPSFVAVSVSMLSTPTPALPMTFNPLFFASSIKYPGIFAVLTIIASILSPISLSKVFGEMFDG